MRFVELNQTQLDNFVVKQKHSQFLQSFAWGEFQTLLGKRVWRYGIEKDGKIIFALSLIEHNLPLGLKYLYSPRIGLKFLGQEQFIFLLTEIGKLAKKEKLIFWRFEPRSKLTIKNNKLQIKKTIDVQASQTSILTLDKTEEELMKSMHQKTRYNIRLAKKRGIKIRKATVSDFWVWWELMKTTANRDGFRLHPKSHYEQMFKLEFLKLFVADYKGKILAGNMVSVFGDMAIYLHGASGNEHRNLMAPHLLQWEAIKYAKEKNCRYYDFNGIGKKKWPGVSRFKMGFGGQTIDYPGAFDLIFNPLLYKIYLLARIIRRKGR